MSSSHYQSSRPVGQSEHHYQTFSTNPPRSRGKPLPPNALRRNNTDQSGGSAQSSDSHNESPLPKKQLAVLAVIALAEQTALNSMSPYLPEMVSTFPEVKKGQVGLSVGAIASAFALAQFATGFFWGWLSDKIGRKPVIVTGVFLTSACFLAFGFCRTLWQAILVQVFMGLVNGNQGVVSTCLGEITDRSNQSRAFAYLPIVYGLGGITGPMVGGLLVAKTNNSIPRIREYPYLLPNIVSSGVLLVELLVTILFLDESLDEAKDLAPISTRIQSLFAHLWQFSSSTRPTYTRTRTDSHASATLRSSGAAEDDDLPSTDVESTCSSIQWIPNTDTSDLRTRDILNRDTILILATYLVFQLSNVAYNSLYPVFAQEEPPVGRALHPEEIGISLAFAGLVAICAQIGLFGMLREKVGNKITYRCGLAGFVVAFVLMPFVGYKGSTTETVWLWIELGVVLIIKTIASIGGLTAALLLITNSAPDHRVLGALNGLAQTLSAAGRAVGPFISGGLFTLATRIRPKGEAMPFGVFGGISFVGFLLSFAIRGGQLEAEPESEDSADEGHNTHQTPNERSHLVNGAK